jgi:tetratricopeptide (TPR) repeat protein
VRAPAAVHFNRALAALQAGALPEAAAAADEAAARGGPEFAALRDFVLGNVAFARAARAEALASLPDVPPTAFDPAIAQAEAARGAWLAAAASRPDWPEARRNVERALVKLEELRRKRQEAADRMRSDRPKPRPRPRPEPPPPEPPAPREPERVEGRPEPQPEPPRVELTPDQVRRLLETLERKEQEKVALRRARQRAREREVERDW